MSQNTAVIVSAVRTPCGRAIKGSLANVRPEDMAATAVRAAIEAVPGLKLEEIEDVVLGCAMPEGPQGMNIARIVAILSGMPTHVPGVTVNRFCSSGLQSIAQSAERIIAGGADIIVAGGVESMSAVPMGGFSYLPHPGLVETHPELFMPMGNTAEEVAEKYDISRVDQDAFAVESQRRAVEAMKTGAFDDEIVPINTPRGSLETDELPREGTTAEGLGKLRPAFKVGGTATAGNSSPLTDGAAAVVLMSEAKAKEMGLEILGIFRGYQVAGVPPELMGIGPMAAIPKLLKHTGVPLDQIDHIELNEAFAAQSLAVIRDLGLDTSKVNPYGGAIALGHPLGATGSKLTATVLHALKRNGGRYGVVTMCIGGGMGAAALFERPAS